MQAQNPSGSGIEATTNAFKVGDDVTFVGLEMKYLCVDISS